MAGSAVVVAVCSMRWRLMMYRMVHEARLGIALRAASLFDLLATRDREAVDAAMERYISAIAPASVGSPRSCSDSSERSRGSVCSRSPSSPSRPAATSAT